MSKEYTPLIIIGAGRSGTNMLRDIITDIEGFHTWDCDEINPIWRYGNKEWPTDELPLNRLTPAIKKFIRGRFEKLHKQSGAPFIVEKTCANSLRLEYVHTVFPEAKYIIINRDGRDVVPSAMKRWGASFELSYTLRKLRYVPLRDLFFYVWRFGSNRLKQMVTKKDQLSFWGPLYEGIENDVETLPLMEVCAKQWQACAERTIAQRENLTPDQIFDVNYETFVKEPNSELRRLSEFLGISLDEEEIERLVKNVSTRSVGSHNRKFSEDQLKRLTNILQPTLKKLGYT